MVDSLLVECTVIDSLSVDFTVECTVVDRLSVTNLYKNPLFRDSSIKECQQLSAPSMTATVVSLPITLSPLEYCAIFFFRP